MTPIFYIKQGNLSFADKIVLSDIEIYLSPGDKICLIGRNGCGKSSLMKVISGDYELDSGELFQDRACNVGYLRQDVKTSINMTVTEFIAQQLTDPENDKYQIDMILEKLQLDGDLNLANASGGQIRRAYLAKALIEEPALLLLDEPTNHLDIATIEWLEEFVKSYKGAIVCISHDRTFLSNVTNKIWWLDRGILRKSDQGFKYFEQWQEQIIEYEEAMLRKLNKKLEAENDWLNAGVTARRKRNQKRLANLIALRQAAKQHSEKLASAKRRAEIDAIENVKNTKFIIEAEDISFGYNKSNIISHFSFRVKKGEKIGIIGPNGSGKSTFIKLLTKQLEPSSGKIIHGTNLEISYFDQHRVAINPNLTVKELLCPTGTDQIFLPHKTLHVAAYLKQFMFNPSLLNAKLSILSGGEASRLLLAKTLINPGNLLILDEPTNDLDMDSLELLLETLADYQGTLLIVSHDRDFLDRLVTRSLIFTNNTIYDMHGGYEDYQKFIRSQQESQSLEPKKAVHDRDYKQKQVRKTDQSVTPNTAKKLSYNDQRFLDNVESEVERLENNIKTIEAALQDPELYLKNQAKFEELTNQLEKRRNELETTMQRWLDLQ